MFDSGSFLRRRHRNRKKDSLSNGETKLTDALKTLDKFSAIHYHTNTSNHNHNLSTTTNNNNISQSSNNISSSNANNNGISSS